MANLVNRIIFPLKTIKEKMSLLLKKSGQISMGILKPEISSVFRGYFLLNIFLIKRPTILRILSI